MLSFAYQSSCDLFPADERGLQGIYPTNPFFRRPTTTSEIPSKRNGTNPLSFPEICEHTRQLGTFDKPEYRILFFQSFARNVQWKTKEFASSERDKQYTEHDFDSLPLKTCTTFGSLRNRKGVRNATFLATEKPKTYFAC